MKLVKSGDATAIVLIWAMAAMKHAEMPGNWWRKSISMQPQGACRRYRNCGRSIFIRDNMESDRELWSSEWPLALWIQVCHFGYRSYPLIRQKHPKNTCRILKCSSAVRRWLNQPTRHHVPNMTKHQTNLEPAMQLEFCYEHDLLGGFLKWGYPNSWMFFVRENPI